MMEKLVETVEEGLVWKEEEEEEVEMEEENG